MNNLKYNPTILLFFVFFIMVTNSNINACKFCNPYYSFQGSVQTSDKIFVGIMLNSTDSIGPRVRVKYSILGSEEKNNIIKLRTYASTVPFKCEKGDSVICFFTNRNLSRIGIVPIKYKCEVLYFLSKRDKPISQEEAECLANGLSEKAISIGKQYLNDY